MRSVRQRLSSGTGNRRIVLWMQRLRRLAEWLCFMPRYSKEVNRQSTVWKMGLSCLNKISYDFSRPDAGNWWLLMHGLGCKLPLATVICLHHAFLGFNEAFPLYSRMKTNRTITEILHYPSLSLKYVRVICRGCRCTERKLRIHCHEDVRRCVML